MASSIDLSSRQDLRELADVVGAIAGALPGREPLLVGALARDILLSYAHGIELQRATHDIDFAFAVATWDEFKAMRSALVASGDFAEVDGNLHRLQFRSNTCVDILPFGGVEGSGRTIAWPPHGDSVMNVVGYREAVAHAIEVRLPGGGHVRVVSLPALAVLKLFAWKDRRTMDPRGKDAVDLWSVLRNYLEAGNQERAYAEAAHLFELPDYDHARTGAWMLGRDIRSLLQQGDGHALTATIDLLREEVDPDGSLNLARDMNGRNAQAAIDLLRSLFSGLNSNPVP